MVNQVPKLEEIYQVRQKLTAMWHEYWLQHDLFSFQWWLLIAAAIIPWVLWWKLMERKKMLIILLYGTLLSIIVLLLDTIGDQLNLWTYPYKITRLFPQLGPADLAVFPVLHMLIYQYFKKWSSFIWASIVFAFAFALIAEPILVWLELYQLNHWKYIYSVPLYIAKAILIKCLVEFFVKKANS